MVEKDIVSAVKYRNEIKCILLCKEISKDERRSLEYIAWRSECFTVRQRVQWITIVWVFPLRYT